MPEVSVVIAAHNAGRTIDAALASVFAQTFRDFEIIVVDDGSTDDTQERVAQCDQSVNYRWQPHRGTSAARNHALAVSSAPLIAFLDAGDAWLPRKLDRQVAYFKDFPETGLLHSAAILSHAPTKAILETADRLPLDVTGDRPVRQLVTRLRDRRVCATSVMVPRDVLAEVGGFGDGDLDGRRLWMRIAARYPVGYLPMPLAIRRADTPRAARRRQLSLVHDTAYRRARKALARVVHSVDDALSRVSRRRVRVLFEATSPVSLAVFQPVLHCLKQDPRIEFWFTSCDKRWSAESIFGVGERVTAPSAVRWMKFDAYINTDFWNVTWLPRRTRRVHFFHGVAGKYGLDAPTSIAPVVAAFDRLAFPNRDRLERYAEAGLVDADSDQAALIGYPKVDCLVDGSFDRRAILAELGLDPDIPTVLYAPTWSPYSSLRTMGETIVTAIRRLGVNVIVKLHDRSNEPSMRGSGGIDWHARFSRSHRDPHVHVASGPDASPYMFAADALVTDHSSVGFEFMLLDRPIVVVDSPRLAVRARINPDKIALLQNAADVVTTAARLGRTIESALAEPSRHSAYRRATAARLFYGAGGATQRAVNMVYRLLELPEPQTVPATVDIAHPIPIFARTL